MPTFGIKIHQQALFRVTFVPHGSDIPETFQESLATYAHGLYHYLYFHSIFTYFFFFFCQIQKNLGVWIALHHHPDHLKCQTAILPMAQNLKKNKNKTPLEEWAYLEPCTG